MDLRALRYFVATVDAGSISGAAQTCYVAQPSITQAIRKLEAQLSCELLTRHRKGVTPTEKGNELYLRASELLQHAKSIENQLLEPSDTLNVTIALSPNIQVTYIGQVLSVCREIQPGMTFHIVEDRNKADLFICGKSSALPNCPFFPIAKERYALLIPKSNPIAFKTKLTWKDLDQQALIERRHCENRPLLEKVIALFELTLPVVATVENEEWAQSLVAAGLGISISPVSGDLEDPRFKIRYLGDISDMETPERQVGLCVNTKLSTSKTEFLDELCRNLAKGKA